MDIFAQNADVFHKHFIFFIFAPNVDVMKHTQRRNERINGGDQVMFSKVDECDEEGRTGLIHATLQGKVGLISFIVTSKITALQGQAYILDITNGASCQSGEHG